MRRLLLVVVACLVARDAGAETAPRDIVAKTPDVAAVTVCRAGSRRYARVELYFGSASEKPDHAWRNFLARVVTPRFPLGFTALDAAGQWRGTRGLEREASHVIVIFYRPDASSEGRIEAIRSAYKARFKQQSVLRADSEVCLSF